jgi:hypothetical protein
VKKQLQENREANAMLGQKKLEAERTAQNALDASFAEAIAESTAPQQDKNIQNLLSEGAAVGQASMKRMLDERAGSR